MVLHDDNDFVAAARYLPGVRERSIPAYGRGTETAVSGPPGAGSGWNESKPH